MTTIDTEEPKLHIYLAGPMRGLPEFNFPAFAEGTARLIARGHNVFSPAQRDLDTGFDPTGMDGNEDLSELGFDLRHALGADTHWICKTADCVVVLEGWEMSAGANAECMLARALGLPVYELDDFLSVPYGKPFNWATKLPTAADLFDVKEEAGIAHDLGLRSQQTNSPTIAELDPCPPGPHTWRTAREAEAAAKLTGALGEPLAQEIIASFDTTVDEFGTGEVRTVSATGGEKGLKLDRYDLIPAEALRLEAHHYGLGARKYADHNWELGYEWHKSYGALLRHAGLFWAGENMDNDPELGEPSPHLCGVIFHARALLHFSTFPDFRPAPDKPSYGELDTRRIYRMNPPQEA